MKLTELRTAIVNEIQSVRVSLSSSLGDADVATATVRGVLSPRVELERESTGYFIEAYPLTRLVSRITRGESQTSYLFRVVVRRREVGSTASAREALADKFLDFTDALFDALVRIHGPNWGVVSTRESDSSARDMLETEHVHLALWDFEVVK